MISASVMNREINDVVSAECDFDCIGDELLAHLVGWHCDVEGFGLAVGQIDGHRDGFIWC